MKEWGNTSVEWQERTAGVEVLSAAQTLPSAVWEKRNLSGSLSILDQTKPVYSEHRVAFKLILCMHASVVCYLRLILIKKLYAAVSLKNQSYLQQKYVKPYNEKPYWKLKPDICLQLREDSLLKIS